MTESNIDQELVKKIKIGHQALLVDIDEINQVARSYNIAKPRIRSFQEHLFAHFSIQKDKMYEWLTAKVLGVREDQKMIEFLTQDLKELKVKSLLFFDEFPADLGDVKAVNFPKKFADFCGAVIGRIHLEEEYLIPLLEKA